jgi:hypothetical protein
MKATCCICNESYEHKCCDDAKTCPYRYCDECWEKLMCEIFDCEPEELLMNQ